MSNNSLLSGKFKKFCNIEDTEAFDVDGAAELVDSVITMWVMFLDGGTLGIIVRVNNCVDILCFTPFHKFDEHFLHFLKFKLSCTCKSE